MEEQVTNTQPQAQTVPPVPGAIIALVFGIISLVLCWYFWFPIVGLVLNILCLVFAIMAMGKGKKAMAEFTANPTLYKPSSFNLAKVGKILGLVGVILNGILLLVAIIFTIIGGALIGASHNM
ncbi:MAG: hypothetical protein WCK10_03725 [Candidatus Staskawiczbacteria bacterium]